MIDAQAHSNILSPQSLTSPESSFPVSSMPNGLNFIPAQMFQNQLLQAQQAAQVSTAMRTISESRTLCKYWDYLPTYASHNEIDY